jgi:hypothetical protein
LITGGNIYSQDVNKDVVEINLSSEQDSVKKNEFTVFININIKKGWHLNSNKPFDSYLTPTSVRLKHTPGIKVLNVEYPQEIIAKLKFSDSELSLYEGNVTIKVKIERNDSQTKSVSFVLEYQSCNNQTCLFPVQKTLSFHLNKGS